MKRLILLILSLTLVGYSQQRYLITPTNEAIPLKEGESALDVAVRTDLVHRNRSADCLDKYTFGYTQNFYPPEVEFKIHHKDAIATLFTAPVTGTIDTVFWLMGSQIGTLDSLGYFRIHVAGISADHGPGDGIYPPPCTPWGYWINTNDLDQGVTGFIEESTDTTWISTVPGSTPSFPPLWNELWGDGFPIILRPNIAGFISMADMGWSLPVTSGQSFFISCRINSLNQHINPPETPTTWMANVSQASIPSRAWVFYEHSNSPSAPGCGRFGSLPPGWYAIGGPTGYNDAYVWNWWFTMTISNKFPPPFISVDQLNHTLSTYSREIQVEIFECPTLEPESARVTSADISYGISGATLDSAIVPMTFLGGFTWAAFLPGAHHNSLVRYSITARYRNGEVSSTPWYSYKIIPLSNAYYTLDTSMSYSWVEIESTGTAISNWFGAEQTAGPFDLGGAFKLFGSDVRYAWIGVDGALSLSTTPTDTIPVTLCPASYPKDIPSTCLPRNFISPFFNDLLLAYWKNHSASRLSNGGVYYQQDGSKFIIEWNSVRNTNDSTDTATLQVILDHSDNSITFQYNDVGTSGLDSSALVGLQSEPIEKWFFVNQNGAPPELRPRNGKAIRLKPNFTLQVHAGWNLISNPALVIDERTSVLFPDAISSAFTFQNGYVRTDTLKHGRGYWLKFPNAQTLGINGDSRLADTIDVTQGWNIIGSISVPVPVSSIVQISEGIIASDFFEYTGGGYAIADTIKPGCGYWVKVSANGKLVLSSPGSSKIGKGLR